MSDERIVRTLEFECLEENRTAHVITEWRKVDGEHRLVGVQCDNPRLASLDDWECRWSCWRRIEHELSAKGAVPTNPAGGA